MKKDQSKYKITELKAIICLYQMENHNTWHVQHTKNMDAMNNYLRDIQAQSKNKVTAKKFFEIDRITGSFYGEDYEDGKQMPQRRAPNSI